MGHRLVLHQLLLNLMGTNNVYFQPPESVKMDYPCIVYKRSFVATKFASDFPYVYETEYQLTVIDRDPDSEIPGKVVILPKCSFVRHYTVDNLNHDVYKLYY